MKHVGVWILLVGLFGGTQGLHAEETQESAPVTTNTVDVVAAELWSMMHDAAMIDDEQYQYVLESGHLPINTTVKDSPIPEEEQGDLMNLAQHEVITPEELVSILYHGSMPDMTDAEYQAFVDLAPVYEPDRAKRLTYDLRRKHAKVDLIRVSHQLRKELESREAETKTKAEVLGISKEIKISDGQTASLQFIDKLDHPHYLDFYGIKQMC